MESQDNDIVYDPDQDPEEKRDLRRKYRSLYKSTTEGMTYYSALEVNWYDRITWKMRKAMQETSQRSSWWKRLNSRTLCSTKVRRLLNLPTHMFSHEDTQ